MACGLPVVGVRALAIPYIVHHGKNGMLSKPGNAREMAKNLLLLLKDKQKREQFGKESLKIVQEFSLESVIDQLESVYASLRRRN
jgi:glycosyltransferase involved in cell wall biosynthesis